MRRPRSLFAFTANVTIMTITAVLLARWANGTVIPWSTSSSTKLSSRRSLLLPSAPRSSSGSGRNRGLCCFRSIRAGTPRRWLHVEGAATAGRSPDVESSSVTSVQHRNKHERAGTQSVTACRMLSRPDGDRALHMASDGTMNELYSPLYAVPTARRRHVTKMQMGRRKKSTVPAAVATDDTGVDQTHEQETDARIVSDDDSSSTIVEPGSNELLHPQQLGPLKMPKGLSPSSVMEFLNCPQSFLFQYLYSLKQPNNLALAKGKMCHAALEQIFDLDPPERTLENLHNLFRANWANVRMDDNYRYLFETDGSQPDSFVDGSTSSTSDIPAHNVTTVNTTGDDGHSDAVRDLKAEREWGLSGLKLLYNYVKLENPMSITRPNPMKRELWVVSKLPVDPSLGVTSPTHPSKLDSSDGSDDEDAELVDGDAFDDSKLNITLDLESDGSNDDDDEHPNATKDASDDDVPKFLVRGIVDRLDLVKDGPGSGVSYRIVDYKSGKAPHMKYPPAVRKRIMEENFFQLKIYALLLRENAGKYAKSKRRRLDHRFLRLLYLTSHNGNAQAMDYDLGATQEERDAELNAVHTELSNTWMEIQELVDGQDPTAFVGCDRSFCYCHKCRPRFVPGTVWEPPSF